MRASRARFTNPNPNPDPTPQGYLKLSAKKRFNQLRDVCHAIHWEKCKVPSAAIAYCTKTDTRLTESEELESGMAAGPFVGGGVVLPVQLPRDRPRFLAREDLYPWQEEVVRLHESPPDDRKVHWYWEETGNVGKTALARHLVGAYPGEVLCVGGKGADMRYALASWVREKGSAPKTLVLLLARSREQYLSYEGIEALKDGLFFSSKYESEMVFYNPPHIIVFANWEPDRAQMSRDRWSVHHVASLRVEPSTPGPIGEYRRPQTPTAPRRVAPIRYVHRRRVRVRVRGALP
jgi:hypothetical protein